jgi:hypothetical protein
MAVPGGWSERRCAHRQEIDDRRNMSFLRRRCAVTDRVPVDVASARREPVQSDHRYGQQ